MFRSTKTILIAVLGGVLTMGTANALHLPRPGDWVQYKVIPASEWTPAAVSELVLTLGPPARLRDTDLVWWQMEAIKPDGERFVVQALSERAPMTAENGDIGAVFTYRFRLSDTPAVEYVDARTGLAYLPIFGFRTGLVPTPRGPVHTAGGFLGTGNYLGQALAARSWGSDGKWLDPGATTRVTLDDDLLIGTARSFRDDGAGADESGEYRYVELTSEDYASMLDAGFNIFMVDNKHQQFVNERGAFFVRGGFGKDGYPALLYRSNYWGSAMFTDEPASRLNTADCRTVYDAANLLKLRDYAYHRMPGNTQSDYRLSQSDSIITMINAAGFNSGDWLPLQLHVPTWETYFETAFYQLQGGAPAMVHEGRYSLAAHNGVLGSAIGPGAETDTAGMYNYVYSFLRGAARCFAGDWGTAIYGQADYTIAPEAVRRAYDMGAKYVWFWTSDHGHHLPFPRQLELARVARDHQKAHPRVSRVPQLRAARVAVAVPDGYTCTGGPWMWGNQDFAMDKLNELGVTYGDINSLANWEIHRLVDAGVEFDCIVDVPEIIDNAGYERIIRIGADGRSNLPPPSMPAVAPAVSTDKPVASSEYAPAAGAPVVKAAHVSREPRIDGSLEEWAGAGWIDLTDQQMYSPDRHWSGDSDLTAKAAFAYDEAAVYIAVQVRDDVLSTPNRSSRIWLNDSVQVAFDPLLNPHPPLNYASDDSEIGFSMVDGRPYAHAWKRGQAGPAGELPGSEVAIVRQGDATVYEARVPFASLWPLTPAFPGRCGVNVAVNDSDGDTRKGALAWRSGLADEKNPSNFGVLEFAGSANLKNLPMMAFAEARKTVVRQGQKAEFVLHTGTRAATEVELSVKVWRHGMEAPAAGKRIRVPAGAAHFAVGLDTSGLDSSDYRVEFEVTNGGVKACNQSLRLYVLPKR